MDKVRLQVRKAKFYTSPNLHTSNPFALHNQTRKWVDKFVEGEEKHGWHLIGKPFVQRITVVEESGIGPSLVSDIGGLWHPYMLKKHFIIPSAHPYARPDQDLYMIWAQMWQEWKPVTQEVPDDILEDIIDRDKLPKGWEVV